MDRTTLSPRNRSRPPLSRSSSASVPSIAVSEHSTGIAPPYSASSSENASVTSLSDDAAHPPGGGGGSATSGAHDSEIHSSYSTGVFDSDSDAVSVLSVASSIAAPQTTLSEIIRNSRKVSIDQGASVEAAFELLARHNLNCVPISQNGHICDWFDYADLTGYLLLVLGHITVKGEHTPEFQRLLAKARNGVPAPVGFAAQFGGGRDPFVRLSSDVPISAAFDRFARGMHRIAVTHPQSGDVVGLLSQRQLVRYVWEHPRFFPGLEWALDQTVDELKAGTIGDVVAIQGEQPLLDAFDSMHCHAVSSVAVVDGARNLLGNISVVDVGLVSRAWQAGLLQESCKHFLSVILDHRSLQEGGNESVPVFFVDRQTRLSKVIALLVSTGAHRLWICEPTDDPANNGKLIGVISLTDVLNVVMRLAGLSLDPEAARRNRRSSSSSVRTPRRPRLSFSRKQQQER